MTLYIFIWLKKNQEEYNSENPDIAITVDATSHLSCTSYSKRVISLKLCLENFWRFTYGSLLSLFLCLVKDFMMGSRNVSGMLECRHLTTEMMLSSFNILIIGGNMSVVALECCMLLNGKMYLSKW